MRIVILAKSNKRMKNGTYGKCVAGINEYGEWIRLVSADNGDAIPQDEAENIPLNCVIDAEIREVPLSHQTENAVLLRYEITDDDAQSYINNILPIDEFGIFGNSEKMLTEEEADMTEGTLRLVDVTDLKTYRREGETCRASFVYQGEQYTDIAMTDPDCYAMVGTVRRYGNATIVVSLPEDPPFMKFIAAIYCHDD